MSPPPPPDIRKSFALFQISRPSPACPSIKSSIWPVGVLLIVLIVTEGKSKELRGEPVSVPLCPPQILHEVAYLGLNQGLCSEGVAGDCLRRGQAYGLQACGELWPDSRPTGAAAAELRTEPLKAPEMGVRASRWLIGDGDWPWMV